MKEKVIELLKTLGIDFDFLKHPAVSAMRDLESISDKTDSVYLKNLFLRNAGGSRYHLVMAYGDKRVDLKALAKAIGSSRLSFASDERLWQALRILPGSIGPFGLMQDEKHAVSAVLDRDAVGQSRIAAHPNDNGATVILAYSDLMKVFSYLKAEVTVIDIPEVTE